MKFAMKRLLFRPSYGAVISRCSLYIGKFVMRDLVGIFLAYLIPKNKSGKSRERSRRRRPRQPQIVWLRRSREPACTVIDLNVRRTI